MGPAPPTYENLPIKEKTAKELTSPDRRSEADHDNISMTAGSQCREDVSCSTADLMTQKNGPEWDFGM